MAVASNFPAIRPSLNLDFANASALDPRITFSRASAGAYFDGKTFAKAEENLLTSSQESNNWSKTAATVASNAVLAPDSTATADTLIASAGISTHSIYQIYGSIESAKTFTLSVNAKKGTSNFINLSIATTSSNSIFAAASFNLDTGLVAATRAVGSGFSVTSATIEPSIPMATGWYRCILTGVHSGTVSVISGIGIGSTGSVATNQGGMESFAAAGTETVHIWGAQLEQRASATAYTPTTDQRISNFIPVLQTAPAGVPRIDHDLVTGECKGLLVEPQRTNLLLNSDVLATQAVVVAAAAHTLSFFGTGTVTLSGAATGTLTGSSSSARSVLTFTPTAGTLTLTVTGNCTLSQLEAGDSATSYIRTEGSQATRAADSIQVNGLGQIGAGTIYVDAAVRNGNTLVTSGMTTAAATASTRQKTAVAYDLTSTRKSINGAAVTSAGGTQGGSNISIAPGAEGWVRKLSIYPQKFGDAHLQALTA